MGNFPWSKEVEEAILNTDPNADVVKIALQHIAERIDQALSGINHITTAVEELRRDLGKEQLERVDMKADIKQSQKDIAVLTTIIQGKDNEGGGLRDRFNELDGRIKWTWGICAAAAGGMYALVELLKSLGVFSAHH